MERMFKEFTLGKLKLANRFVFPPVKTGYGTPGGTVTDRQLNFYRRIAKNGPMPAEQPIPKPPAQNRKRPL